MHMKKFLIVFTTLWIVALLIINYTQVEMAKFFLLLNTFVLGISIYFIILQIKLIIDIANKVSKRQSVLSWQLLLLILIIAIEVYSIWFVVYN